MAIDTRTLDHLSWLQHGVLARRQFLDAGVTDNDIERWVRRRRLVAARPGVYVNHTGPLTPAQREWVAVLAAWPAALSHESAIPGLRSDRVQVAIDVRRTIELPGVQVHRMAHFAERTDWRAAPPRIKVADAVIDVMSGRISNDDVAGAYAALATATHAATQPDRIARALARRERVAGRGLIAGMVADVEAGACSVLERGYLHRVERPHGLPRGRRQPGSLATGKRTMKDVRYDKYGLIVELNGRMIHDRPQAWDADAERDLAELAVAEAVTARVTYGLVFRHQCRTAAWIGRILHRRGWTGMLFACPSCPTG
ncbi:hypothetical protein D0Z08_14010 [Nocardioides immobilis]|uniref:Type IV toxin-antitoxin system AbiEi family antitoxin domain-containing protein n=2 Tax=Nocardioides immobilis TaxID=2049295 RepID=A0A417Y1N7_9ACTN|nr:hypothetical protein D0Z08_14010 [Nocardioides immobilis]